MSNLITTIWVLVNMSKLARPRQVLFCMTSLNPKKLSDIPDCSHGRVSLFKDKQNNRFLKCKCTFKIDMYWLFSVFGEMPLIGFQLRKHCLSFLTSLICFCVTFLCFTIMRLPLLCLYLQHVDLIVHVNCIPKASSGRYTSRRSCGLFVSKRAELFGT